jgi:hypothetical protein
MLDATLEVVGRDTKAARLAWIADLVTQTSSGGLPNRPGCRSRRSAGFSVSCYPSCLSPTRAIMSGSKSRLICNHRGRRPGSGRFFLGASFCDRTLFAASQPGLFSAYGILMAVYLALWGVLQNDGAERARS